MNREIEEFIHRKLSYFPETGLVCWKYGPSSYRENSAAGNLRDDGYIDIRVSGTLIRAHRIAWFLAKGYWPIDKIDHINGIRSDNRIENLRECCSKENSENITKKSGNKHKSYTSKYLGVSWSKQKRKWVAQIRDGGSSKHLGSFESEEDASSAYLAEKSRIHSFNPVPRKA